MTEEKITQFNGQPLVESEAQALQALMAEHHIKFEVDDMLLDNNYIILLKDAHVIGISLPNLKLAEFPAALLQFPFLEEIELSFNDLTALPPWLLNLTHLKEITLSHNHFEHLDHRQLPPQIEVVRIAHNLLTEIPQHHFTLNNLRVLRLEGNKLATFPDCLKNCPNIEELFLDFNPLTDIPDWSEFLPKLDMLYLNGCNLSNVPTNITKYSSLTSIHLEKNHIRDIPAELTQLGNLEFISLKENKIQSLPRALTRLPRLKNIALLNNEFQDRFTDFTPEELAKLSYDETTFHHDNPFLKFLKGQKDLLKVMEDGTLEINELDTFGASPRVKFDTENSTMRPEQSYYPAEVMGLHEVEGQAFLGVAAGGDWEFPVFLIFYEKDGRLYKYIPTFGNAWNQETKAAFGNDIRSDLGYLQSILNDPALTTLIKEKGIDKISSTDLDPIIKKMIKARLLLNDIKNVLTAPPA